MKVRPLDEIEVFTHRFEAADGVPNNPTLPLVAMRGALGADTGPIELKRILGGNGWGGMWQWKIFPYHHYHPNAHEVLACVSGAAEVMLGGPAGRRFSVMKRDVLILPAGLGHCQIEASPDFSVCGAYPHGQERYITLRAEEIPLDEAADRIACVEAPASDPIYGASGPLVGAWGLGI
ncbi:cupin domain-containing protein [Acuticoccus sp. I52.16.1]|uniref:cupin domain-containing protein n=1 Tax=Acuticoccus sp. I52.16.1 TaxID=2928472 RepID=UPI001FD3DDFB|nr:cupin domain-containing protein [Acuticoccus sp. I52.16.1]UOM34268.1 cupin [Acuticoccus sp. I52.16.1]